MPSSVDLSRLQFAVTAMYHFLFVPLTLGLALILAMMESVYVLTGRDIWKQMTKFWGLLFGINFAMGVATGITLEFQFGTNWAYYSQYVGDIFGVPLAIEGMMAFFLEATFIGLFFFGWDKLSKRAHLFVTWALAIATNFSALWILIANGWMQNPVGAAFNPDTMRMELTSLYEVFFNPVAQCKFVHTVSAGYVTGSIFVITISAFYLLRKRHTDFALKSIRIAALFGFLSAICVIVLGDASGYVAGLNQQMKVAAIEGMWKTEPPPAPLTLIGIPDAQAQQNHYAIQIPYALGLIVTRSFDKPIPGIQELVETAKHRIRRGVMAYRALQKYRCNPEDQKNLRTFLRYKEHLGYGLLLKRYLKDLNQVTPSYVQQAAEGTTPNVLVLFFAFRIMVGCGLFFLFFFTAAMILSWRQRLAQHPWFLRTACLALPLPWIASWSGWIVAEYGRQPWVIDGIPFRFDEELRLHVDPTGSGITPLVVCSSALWVFLCAQHGGLYLLLKTGGVIRTRVHALLTPCLWASNFLFLLLLSFWKQTPPMQMKGTTNGPSNPLLKTMTSIASEPAENFMQWLPLEGFPAFCWLLFLTLSLIVGALLYNKKAGSAFVIHGLLLGTVITFMGVCHFPIIVLSSTQPSHSLTIWDASSSLLTLKVMLGSVVLFLPLILAYTTWAYHVFWGRISQEKISANSKEFY